MSVNINTSPYHDDFDPAKKYIQMLALPGRAEQAREFTQIQSMMLHFLKQMGATLFREGNIVNGMAFAVQGNTLTVEPGQVYLEGIVHNFDGASLTLTAEGKEEVGIKLVKSIVTEEQDITLRDPAQGHANYALPGAHRIKAVPTLTLDDPGAPLIYTFVDGVIQTEVSVNYDGGISDILARRTYDEAGNYKVFGLSMFTEAGKTPDALTLTIEAGKAYVRGYEVEKPSPVKIQIPKSVSTRDVQNEPKVFHTGTNQYTLNNQPVKAIGRVVATVQASSSITRGSIPNGIDYLPKSPVLEIVSVTQGATSYIQGRDYQLTSDGVDWSLTTGGAIEPSTGGTYTVVWKYTKTMVPTADYKLTVVGTGDSAISKLDFATGGDKPVDNTQVNIDYSFYLARKDLVSLNSKGEVVITSGQSNIPRLIASPTVADPNLLSLGTVYLSPNSNTAICNSYSITRLSMEDLQNAVRRIEDTEYNQALTQLDTEAMSGEDSSALKGIFSDSFVGMTKADTSHPDHNVAFAFDERVILPAATGVKAITPTINLGASQAKVFGRLITTPVTERVSISQPVATSTMLVNPYNVYNRMATMALNPSVDNWVDDQVITVERSDTKTYDVHRWWYHGGTLYNDTERYLFNNLQLDAGMAYDGWENITGTITSSTSKTVLDEAILYMRQRTVTVTSQNLIPYSDNLQVLFDGVSVSVTPGGANYSGSTPGTLKADGNGLTWGTFMIPSGIRCGTRDVTIRNGNNSASAPYTANGRQRVVENTVLRTRITLIPNDPLAQSFQMDQDRIMTSVGLYFAAKDPTKNVTIQIRNMINGYPGQVIHAEKVLSPSQVNVSAKGTVETKVSFDDPVPCQANSQYCVVILTESDIYSMFVAELGANSLVDNSVMSKQPYVDGVLFSSSNAITWTAHQTKDLKFQVYTGTFAPTGTIEFNPISDLGIDRLVMFADYLTPQNTGCTWQARLNGGSYQPIENYVDLDLSAVATTVQLRATFTASSTMSPLLSQESFTLIGFITAANASYISRNTVMAQSFTTIKQSFEAFVPAGCQVVARFALDGSGSTWSTNTLVSTEPVDGYYVRYTYQTTVAAGVNFRARIDISSPNQLARPKVRKFINIMK